MDGTCIGKWFPNKKKKDVCSWICISKLPNPQCTIAGAPGIDDRARDRAAVHGLASYIIHESTGTIKRVRLNCC